MTEDEAIKAKLNRIARDALGPLKQGEVLVTYGAPEDWMPTGALRYERGDYGCFLQQEWGSQTGKREWRDVPMAEEGT